MTTKHFREIFEGIKGKPVTILHGYVSDHRATGIIITGFSDFARDIYLHYENDVGEGLKPSTVRSIKSITIT